LQAAFRSDVGRVREVNEDYVFLSDQYPNGWLIAIVADGMGGHLAGEIASKMAVELIVKEIDPTIMEDSYTIDQYKNILEQAIQKANQQVHLKALNEDEYRGMGTTIIASIISPQWIIFGHIGDSRAYLTENNTIKQVTNDHSLVNELLKSGQITEAEANLHPQKNVLTRALGTDDKVKVDMAVINWEKDQTLIMCSDGLSNRLSDQEILEVTQQSHLSPDEMVTHFVSLANQAGGEDNISIIIVRHV